MSLASDQCRLQLPTYGRERGGGFGLGRAVELLGLQPPPLSDLAHGLADDAVSALGAAITRRWHAVRMAGPLGCAYRAVGGALLLTIPPLVRRVNPLPTLGPEIDLLCTRPGQRP